MNLINEFGYDVRSGKRDPRYHAFYVGVIGPDGLSDGGVYYARNEAEAQRKALRQMPKGSRVDMCEKVEGDND